MAVKYQKLVGDFETTTTPEDLRVWAWCLVDIESGEVKGLDNNIESFIEYLSNKNTKIFFHNLKFDAQFIISYLLLNGWRYSETPEPGCFSCLVTDSGVFYSVTIWFARRNKAWKKAVIWDSLKKLPFSAAQVARSFGLPMRKLHIDYSAPRPVGHILTEEEREYIEADCKIIAAALKIQFEQGLTRMTNAADAMADYKNRVGKKTFSYQFPVFGTFLDSEIRTAYKGGFTWLNPRYKGKRGIKGRTYDVNSLYPWAMRTCLLPYGYPIRFEGEPDPDEDYPLYIVKFDAMFELKPGHVPMIQLKNNSRFVETEYISTSRSKLTGEHEPVELSLTSVDYALFHDHYDVIYEEFKVGYKFKAMHGMYDSFIDYWMEEKKKNDDNPALRQIAKLMMNASYGRYAMRPGRVHKVPSLNEDGVVEFKDAPEEEGEPVYTAVAAFITAYARDKTIRAAQACYDRIIYCDTDSLHLEGWEIPEGLEIHKTNLGAWKDEGTFVDSKFLRAKTYVEVITQKPQKVTLEGLALAMSHGQDIVIDREAGTFTHNRVKVTCGGMPENVKAVVRGDGLPEEVRREEVFQNFEIGNTFGGKLIPKRYKGGVVLEPRPFTFK